MSNPLYTQQLMNKYGASWIKFDESSGNVTDSKGSAIGTITGTTRVTGVSGNALSFDGTSYVSFNSKSIPLGKKSIRFKIKKDTLPTEVVETIIGDGYGSTQHGNLISITGTGSIRWISNKAVNGATRFSVSSTKNICDGQWHDVLFTWDGTTNVDGVKVYVDDMVTPNATGTANLTETVVQSNNLGLGKSFDANVYFFKGQLDELEIYNEVINPLANKILLLSNEKVYSLKSNEVKHLTNMTSNVLPAPLVATASSQNNTTLIPFRAFNGINTDANSWATINNSPTGWIQIDYGTVKLANVVYVTNRNNTVDFATSSPKDFNILGSNDGVNFDKIAEIKNQINWTQNQTRKFYISNSKNYRFYRLEILSNNGATYTAIGEILYTQEKGFTEIPSANEDNFINHGSDIIDNISFNFLNKNYILQDTVSENTEGFWTTQINRKPLSIKFD